MKSLQSLNISVQNAAGHVIEFQFHTEKSFEVKNSEEDHSLYEQRRVLPEGSAEYNAILEQQKLLYSVIPVPPGIETIKKDDYKEYLVAN